MSGACRADNTEDSNEDGVVDEKDGSLKINNRYTKTAGANGGPMTQLECKNACEAEEACIAYHRAEGSWCAIFGPGMDVTDDHWTGDSHPITGPIGTPKVNPSYICGVKVPTDTPTTPKPEASIEETQKTSESCRPGPMLALAFWLTRVWQ
jgi:hypothetical protein